MEKTKIVAVTHNGVFHADEVMATAILKQLYDEVEIKRSRNPEDFEVADIVYDVGDGEFDHHNDHKKYRDNGVPYAACGLIWKAFGIEVIKKHNPLLSNKQAYEVFYSVDSYLIESIDAVDNGFIMEKSEIHIPTLDQLVKGFNPNWNTDLDADEQFKKAVDFCTPILANALADSISAIEAEKIVEKSFDNREDDNILILEQFCPWKRFLQNFDEDGDIMYVIFKDRANGYRVQAVSEPDSMESKKPFPIEWAGKKPEVINELVGIDDAIFVHPAGFIAGAGSLESVLKMAELALDD
jgi:uncharacterized UPF0160 family protein